jgi:hypothetical protein
MRKMLTLAVAASALIGFAVPVMAGNWKFGVTNKASYVVTDFRTEENGEWSDNWLDSPIKPGEEFEMDFGTDEGECNVRTQVTFADGSYFDYNVDYCKVSHLNVYNDEIKWK